MARFNLAIKPCVSKILILEVIMSDKKWTDEEILKLWPQAKEDLTRHANCLKLSGLTGVVEQISLLMQLADAQFQQIKNKSRNFNADRAELVEQIKLFVSSRVYKGYKKPFDVKHIASSMIQSNLIVDCGLDEEINDIDTGWEADLQTLASTYDMYARLDSSSYCK